MEVDRIINGNCIEVLQTLPDHSVDLIFADPPYWLRVAGVLRRVEGTEFDGCDDEWDNQFGSQQDYEAFTEQWLTQCRRVLKKHGSIWVIGGMQCIYTIGGVMQKLGFWFISDIIWHKTNPTPNFMGTRPNNSHETLIWATLSKQARFTFNYQTAKELNTDSVGESDYARGIRRQLGSVWRIGVCQGNERLKDAAGAKLHSTQKPEELLYRIITISSRVGDIVLDPFGGTMTTAAVAKRTGRRYIMIEQDEEYCAYGAKRLSAIAPSIGSIEQATLDIKPPKVAVKDMIQQGYLLEGESFYIRGTPTAVLRGDAKLQYQGEAKDMHSCAALALGRKSQRLNGFDHWYVLRDEGLVSIAEIRTQYRVQVLGYGLVSS